MPDKSWKQSERRVAAFFGGKRRPLSGSNSGGGSDDILHPKIYVENKQRKEHAAWTLWEDTRKKARKEKKIPLVTLDKKNHPGFLLVIHSSDFPELVEEYRRSEQSDNPDPPNPKQPIRDSGPYPVPRSQQMLADTMGHISRQLSLDDLLSLTTFLIANHPQQDPRIVQLMKRIPNSPPSKPPVIQTPQGPALDLNQKVDCGLIPEEEDSSAGDVYTPCPSCGSKGFPKSSESPNQCTFCDGTEGGQNPQPSVIQPEDHPGSSQSGCFCEVPGCLPGTCPNTPPSSPKKSKKRKLL